MKKILDWFGLPNSKKEEEKARLKKILYEKYVFFQKVLEENNRALTIMADMEEKLSGEYLFDMHYIQHSVKEILDSVNEIIKNLNALSEGKFTTLENVFHEIKQKIEKILTSKIEIPKTEFTLPLEAIDKDSLLVAGGKITHLAELKNILNISTPEGFVITSYTFLKFIEKTQLKEKIFEILQNIEINKIESLNEGSQQIQELIINSNIPEEILNSIQSSYKHLCKKLNRRCMVSVRSSAIFEDSEFSFAGQYSSFLNVSGESIPYYYKKVIASLFNPRAIFYYKTKGFSETDMVMAVGVLSMVNARSGGVIYTRNPNNPEADSIIITAVRGLGKLVVDGSVTPETYIVNRKGSILEKLPGKQPKMLICKETGGIEEIPLPSSISSTSLNEKEVFELLKIAIKIEEYYGSPQDIEWAIDEEGNIFILQTRQLRTLEKKEETKVYLPTRIKGAKVLVEKGLIACKGVGYGKAFVLNSEEELNQFPEGYILVARHTNPKYVVVMNKAVAIVTDVGSPTGHMASLSREYKVPTLLNTEIATKVIKHGQEITVDAINGVIYEGKIQELIEAYGKTKKEPFQETLIFKTLERVLKLIVPLYLVDPTSKDFKPENCKTLHDITRFCHEMVMHEMFTLWDRYQDSDIHAVPLLAGIPVGILILDIGGGLKEGIKKATPEDILSIPFKAILKGMRSMKWPEPPPVDAKGFLGMIAHTVTIPEEELQETGKKSFCVATQNYMNFSLRLGYHFSMIEAYVGENINDNYVKFFFKGGGAALDRRLRRVKLITEILKDLRFRVKVKEDVIDAVLFKYDSPTIEKTLEILGKLTAFTKQLDMVLFNDAITQMYLEEFRTKYMKELID
ncbi:PEP/pyruvate-binding domain-containing protein [Thermodesulfobacterium sp.]|jgi:pyruvate,water dikinase|uniref:PEP/pyruvate-binding domain-containing protein n=1 Tax=Thermodesulfobacterium sp. TaxID=1965289 RepID=UPI0026490212|nr:PEP/pyruvate-binding domain-containing protein [Thermodesulfobacterium sp.]MDN5380070.1 pyruvate, water dikinase [Thermodesulfobacterium sp.]